MFLKRYEKNPFILGMSFPIKGKRIQLSRLGQDDNVLVNQSTGEVQGTHVVTYKSVDSEQFIKLFTSNIGLTFNLNAAGIKAFNVLMWAVQHKALGKDIVLLDSYLLEDFIKSNDHSLNLSLTTFKRGLNELEKSKLIAKAIRKGWYYINLNFCFNGDRIAFTTLIEKNNSRDKNKDSNTDWVGTLEN